ncbi:MAG: hypothetical protein V4582_07110 [Pseudomonadota bacterium]
MPVGANRKRDHEYKELERKFKQEGRYAGREAEVAARIVNKQRAQYGETRAEEQKDAEGKSPDRNLPIADYQHLTVEQVSASLEKLSDRELRAVQAYEAAHLARKGVLEEIDGRLA